jgi:hypothetical protein
LDQLIQLAISIHYNWDITNKEKNKRHHDLIAAPTQLGPTSPVCYHRGQEGHFYRECLRGDSLGDSPAVVPRLRDPQKPLRSLKSYVKTRSLYSGLSSGSPTSPTQRICTESPKPQLGRAFIEE